MAEEKKAEEKKEEGHEEEEGKKKKKGFPMIWLVIGLLTVLGSAGGTVMFMFMKGDSDETKKGKKAAEHVEESLGEEASGEEAHLEEASEEHAEGGEEDARAGEGDEAGEGGGDEDHANCPKHEEGGGGHGAKAPTYTEIFALEPFIVNLAGEAEKNFLKVTVKLKLAKADCTPLVEPHVAEMRDSILLLLSSKNYETIKTVQGKMELRDEILERVQHIVKGNRVKAAFFTDFVAQ